MIIGLMDHWVPSHSDISDFWKMPYEEARPHMDRIFREIGINNFTFYTKWYSNGIKSELPFLKNDPDSMNVKSNNEWGRKWIDYLHEHNATAGAMLQCYTFEQNCIPPEAVLGYWRQGVVPNTATPGDRVLVDPLWSGYPDMLRKMLTEHLREFPKLDALLLEFEGLGSVGEASLKKWLNMERLTEAPLSPSTLSLFHDFGAAPTPENRWIWTEESLRRLRASLTEHLLIADQVLDELGYTGVRGVVFKALYYEIGYIADAVPSKNWMFLPWYYWGWGSVVDDQLLRRQMDLVQKTLLKYAGEGYPVCYIGNATLPTTRPESIAEMAGFCLRNGMGHLGMGNFIPGGLRWHNSTEEGVEKARELYEKLFPVSIETAK